MCIYVGVLVHRWKWCCLVRCHRTSPRSLSYQHLWAHSPALCRAPAWRHPTGFAGVPFATVLGLVVGWLAVVEVVDAGVVECVGHTSVRRRGCDCWPRCGSSCWPSSVSMACSTSMFEGVSVSGGRGIGHGAGRSCCRWRVLHGCSRLWAWLLAEDWVDSLAVAGVDGVFHKRVRCRGCGCWPRCGWSRVLSAPLALALPVRLRRNISRHSVGAWCVVVGSVRVCGRLVVVAGVDGAGYECVRGCGRACCPRFGSW